MSNFKKYVENKPLPVVRAKDTDTYVYKTWIGIGFYFRKVPDNFKFFLLTHKTDYIINESRFAIFQALTRPEEDDFNKMFEEAKKQYDNLQHPGDIVADILSKITGEGFVYCSDDSNPEDACVMLPDVTYDASNSLMDAVCQVCCELGIESFGTCYFEDRRRKRIYDHTYDVATYTVHSK